MEAIIQQALAAKEGRPALVRYADDFVVLHPTRAGAEKARAVIEQWLMGMGLELKPSKTRITHTLEGEAGFDFLGMTVRQYCVGRTHTARSTHGIPLGFKTLTKPSNEAVKRHIVELGKIVREQRTVPQEGLISHLNPVIVGWANYYRASASKDTYRECDHLLYNQLRRWARRRHPNKSAQWVARKYWTIDKDEGWMFKAQDGKVLKRHAATAIKRHVKVRGRASPYDGNLVYWAQRLKDHPLTSKRTGFLLKLQKGRCALCGLYFKEDDLLETDHIIPRHLGGDDRLMNLQLLHRHCHDRKTAQDGSHQTKTDQGINDNDHLIEEPDDEKPSCPVL
jgi:RNA-directed DNA polymerase